MPKPSRAVRMVSFMFMVLGCLFEGRDSTFLATEPAQPRLMFLGDRRDLIPIVAATQHANEGHDQHLHQRIQSSPRHTRVRNAAKMFLHRVHHIRFRAHARQPPRETPFAVSSLKRPLSTDPHSRNPFHAIPSGLVLVRSPCRWRASRCASAVSLDQGQTRDTWLFPRGSWG